MKTGTSALAALAGVAALAGAGYLGAGAVGTTAVWIAACLAVIVLAAAFARVLALPVPAAAVGIPAASGIAASTLAATTAVPGALDWMPLCVALGLIAVFMVQLLRGTGGRRRLGATLAGAAAVLACALGSGWVAADRLPANAADSPALATAGAGLAAALAVGAIRWPDRITAPLGLFAAAVVSGTLAAGFGADWVAAAATGLVAAVPAVALRAVGVAEKALRTPAGAVAVGLAQVLAAGAMVYFTQLLLLH